MLIPMSMSELEKIIAASFRQSVPKMACFRHKSGKPRQRIRPIGHYYMHLY